MTMKKSVFIFAVGLMAYIRSAAPTVLETVWLKDVTTSLQTDKRTLGDLDLPNELAFHLSRDSETLTLTLKRNHDINPNADVYFVQKLKDGKSVLVKTRTLEKEDVAYYQDRANGAFMTVRCVKKSNEQCDRVINGNIRIGDSSYDLHPAETAVTSRNLLEDPGLLTKQYVLQDHAHIQGDISVEKNEAPHVDEKKVEQDVKVLLQRYKGQHKRNHFPSSDATLSSRNVSALHNSRATDESRYSARNNGDKSCQTGEVYYVKVAVLIDSGLWDIYSSTVRSLIPLTKEGLVKKKIREHFSHIMNGVNLLYKEIGDPSISINVILSRFVIFQREDLFTRNFSTVKTVNGIHYIDAYDYLRDVAEWDKAIGKNLQPQFDHAMLFTSYEMYRNTFDNKYKGLAFTGKVCEPHLRTSVVEAHAYVWTVLASSHELAHSLGSYHDGEGKATACWKDHFFLMSPLLVPAGPSKPYNKNSWFFSNCSVQAFKDTLKDKDCVKHSGNFYNDREYENYVRKQPGLIYTPNEQCRLIKGDGSKCCQTPPENMCHQMRCTDPKTLLCMMETYFGAASGTECGTNKWCIKGMCVSKS